MKAKRRGKGRSADDVDLGSSEFCGSPEQGVDAKASGGWGSRGPECFLNRELGTLGFNRRVLKMAVNPKVPLLERLRYLCIVSNNLDEFFEIRVAGIRERIKDGNSRRSVDGLSAAEEAREVRAKVLELLDRQYEILNESLIPQMEAEGIRFLRRTDWSKEQAAWIKDLFEREILPLLTPIGLDPAHPFPRASNKTLNFLVELDGADALGRAGGVAIVPAPRALPRLIRLPAALGAGDNFVFLSSVVHAFVAELFPGMSVLGCHQFRVTRDSDLFVDEEEVKNLRAAIEGELPTRRFGEAVRLEVSNSCPAPVSEFLLEQFGLGAGDLYVCSGPVNLSRLMALPDALDRPELSFPKHKPELPAALEKGSGDMFALIRSGDVLLHHPYQPFTPVIEMLRQASADPAVAAIKMTVYRTGSDSALMEELVKAASAGKEVAVVVELMARFDEAANLSWARRLEEVGAHVVFGAVGYKTHAKMLLITRREPDAAGRPGLRRYVHLGTGNYHPKTARLYTDFGFFTCDEGLGRDVSEIFRQLTGVGKALRLKKMAQAPFGLHSMILGKIRAQTKLASEGKPALIRAKMNSLVEPELISALYDASEAGVEVRLVVRGVCVLRPGVKGLSENIKVRSVVGRFLEHHRIFAFGSGDSEEVWLSSADWMERNFFGRFEAAFPIEDPSLRRRAIEEGFEACWSESAQCWILEGDGSSRPALENKEPSGSSQLALMELHSKAAHG